MADATLENQETIIAMLTAIQGVLPIVAPGVANGLMILGANTGDTTFTSSSNATPAIKLTGKTTGAGLKLVGGSLGAGLEAEGTGTGSGVKATGGATGIGIEALGGATSGNGIDARGVGSGNGIYAGGIGNAGMYLLGGDDSPGLQGVGGSDSSGIQGVGTGSGDGVEAIKGASGKDIDADEIDNILLDLECDSYVDITTTPWSIVYHKKGDAATVYFKKSLKDTANANVASTASVIGRHVHLA